MSALPKGDIALLHSIISSGARYAAAALRVSDPSNKELWKVSVMFLSPGAIYPPR
jgi:hypothetical protein